MRGVARVLLVAAAVMAASAQSYPPVPVITIPGKLNFAVLGARDDWGRTGGEKSVTPASEGGYDTTGYCTKNFKADVDEDIEGALGQATTALVMDKAIKLHDAKFVVNTGDNFYECGVDTPMRVISDWANIYQGRRTPATSCLTWYTVIGNHDVPLQSVANQLDFGKQEPRWYFPSRYYAVDYVSGDGTKVRSVYVNTNPFVTAYSRSTNRYNGPEINTTNTPAALTAQLQYIEWALSTSTADWTIVVGHHPVVGGAATVYGFNASRVPATNFDLGTRTATGAGSWATLLGLLRTYNVTAYFNGHDHVLTHAVDPEDPVTYTTQYITSGAGSYTDGADSCGATRPFVRYSSSATPNPDCVNAAKLPVASGQNGFNIVKVTKKTFQVAFYTIPNSTIPTGRKDYTLTVRK